MFGIKSDDLPCLYTYDAAKSYYDKVKPWRGGENNKRPLGERRAKHKMIELRDDGAIVCWLYQTPCITYWPDGDLTFEPHSSLSTARFINRIVPPGIHAYFPWNGHSGVLAFCTDGSQNYQIRTFTSTLTLRRVDGYNIYQCMSETEPFRWTTRDRKFTNQALKNTGFREFARYWKVREALDPKRVDLGWPFTLPAYAQRLDWRARNRLEDYARDPATHNRLRQHEFPEVYEELQDFTRSQALDALRDALRRRYELQVGDTGMHEHEVPYFIGWREYWKFRRR